jgi:hypothetical protein
MRKRVLVIAMIDSIHVGRWLEQFLDQEIDFVLFPSKKFRKVHPRIIKQLNAESRMRLSFFYGKRFLSLQGYADYASKVLPEIILGVNSRKLALNHLIKRHKFDYIHCLEIQGAGYLISDIKQSLTLSKTPIIVTNWGSDIFYFKEFKFHEKRIRKTLAVADYYSAECIRDYRLARELGFVGNELPCMPNAGGFLLSDQKEYPRASERRVMVVKTYGGLFGRGVLIIAVMERILAEFPGYSVYFFSVTKDLLPSIKSLANQFGSRVQFSSTLQPVQSEVLHKIFLSSRIYIGCSISDGISTSFLESLTTGTYPIQTDTSCANEWVKKGAIASIIPLDEEILLKEVRVALSNDNLVNFAQISNEIVAKEFLDFRVLKETALMFYGL